MKWLLDQYKNNPNRVYMNGMTFSQVYRDVLGVARHLREPLDGLQRVALLSDNSPLMVIHLFALLLLKKEVLLLNVHLTQHEIIEQLQTLAISTVVTSDTRGALFVCKEDAERLHVLTFSQIQDFHLGGKSLQIVGPDQVNNIPASLVDEDGELDFDWSPDDNQIAIIMNTSATTGKFKSVPIRWRQLKAHVKASAQVLGVQDDDNWLVVLPIFHVSGLSIVLRSLYNGTAITILDKYNQDKVVKLINENTINMVSLVPTILKGLIPYIERHRLRVILLGGEFIPQPLIREAVKKKLPIYKTYGMTETFSQNVTFSVLDHLEKIDSVGKPLPGMVLHILNQDAHGVGEIYLEGPMLMNGYLNQEPIKGLFNTDDIGYLDRDGYLYILNRRKDIIISGGENIYPKELEDLLYSLEEVKECAVVPVPHDKWGQVPALFIVSSLSEQQILSFMEEHLAKYKLPKYIVKKDALPRNASGKILRKELCLAVSN